MINLKKVNHVAVAREPDRFMVAPLLPMPGAKMLSVGGGVCVCTQLTRKVKEYRAQARFKESTMEILLDEAQQMVLLLSSKGNHFEQIMPSLNNIVSRITRAYKEDNAVLDQVSPAPLRDAPP